MRNNRLFDIGRMRHRVALHTITRTDDGSGGFDRQDPSAATKIGNFWAHLEPISGRERTWGEQFTEHTTHKCWLRYSTQVTAGMTLVYRGVNYYVEQAYDPNHLKEWLLLTLREGGPM